MAVPLLLFCAGRNRRYAEIALASGFAYGCRSDYRPLFPVVFADLNWRAPDLERHAAFVAAHRPRLAVAPDVLALDALESTLRYAERLAAYAERVIIVPKCAGAIERLPRAPWLVLGYSVSTPYGSVGNVPEWDFRGWPVHLLGGAPQTQMVLARYLDVVSADGNSHMKAAAWGSFWEHGGWASKKRARSVQGAGFPYRAFALSCQNIRTAWEQATA
jgi:Family of unknown function (DUF6610)